MVDTANSLVARAARELSLSADRLVHEVEQRLRRDVPELWQGPTVMARENVADHVLTALFGLEQGIEPRDVEPPAADIERARLLARHGAPVTAMLRAFRLGQGVILDRMLEEMPRLTNDAELIGAASRRLVALMTGYVDRTSERGVMAFQEERDLRLQWRLATVSEAGMRIGTTLDIARTTQELADVAVEHFADLVTVDLLDSEFHGHDTPAVGPLELRRVALRSIGDDTPEPTVRPEQLHTYQDGSPPARALATGQPSRHHLDGSGPSAGTAAPRTDLAIGDDRFHSMLVVPLRARDTTLGVAQFFRHSTPDLFDDEDLLLAQEIAARAAVAVDNARRYTHARATSLTLQRSLLPRHTPRQSAMDVACRYLPAGGEEGVGGDWYDVIPLSGARVALVVGDVVGHGIHAAATMGRLRTAVRTLADIDLPPDELLTHLDDVVIRLSAEASTDPGRDPDEEAGGDIGATCLYAVYDPVSTHCTMARAGHVLPAVVTPDGSVELLDLPPGPPLGLGGLPFEAADFELPEGSVIAFYTDGLIETRDCGIDSGLAALRHALAQSDPSLEVTCDKVLEAMLPTRPEDDVALLLARTHALGASQVATWDLDADPAAVAGARSNVSRQLAAWGVEQLEFTAELVVSELVTNAIRYGRPPIRLRLIHDHSLICEVSDGSSTTPHLRRARVFEEGGRGLLLVAQLAGRWGTRHSRHGKTVWAELSESDAFPSAGLPELISL
ncbi:SpoIIE family protein phosphatase [Streptomyces sp. NPDC046712]|uniref:ATP-binding SpoIIE family protein phosphatase n=1 Tax=Streptomyces sp. NPDC046712 TaxID=3154802 RepID=UPI003409B117